MDLRQQMKRLGGVARRCELNVTRAQLRHAVERGAVVKVSKGRYALPEVQADVLAAIRHCGHVGCVSALRHHGIEIPGDPSVVHISVPRRRGSSVAVAGVRRHYEEVANGVGRVTGIEESAARAATCQGYDDAVVILDRVLNQRPHTDLEAILSHVERTSPSRAKALRLDVCRQARSASETRVRLALRRAGLPVLAGVDVPGIGEVDFLIAGCLVLELDGFMYHMDRKPFVVDRRRDRAAFRLALHTSRFPYQDSDPIGVLREVGPILRQLDAGTRVYSELIPPVVRGLVDEVRERCLGPEGHRAGWQHLVGSDARMVEDQVRQARAAVAPRGPAGVPMMVTF